MKTHVVKLLVLTLLSLHALPSVHARADTHKAPSSATAKVDLNEASATELVKLPGIGPALAERILASRAKRPFRHTKELRRIKGIGYRKYQKLLPWITVRASKTAQTPRTTPKRLKRRGAKQ